MRFWAVGIVSSLAIAACAAPEAEQLPAVQISGQSGVRMGQTLTLTATTIEGTDTGYSWVSADPSIATVEPTGTQVTVTPVAPGETTITVTGDDSGLSGEHNVVVIALDAPDVIVPDATEDADTSVPDTIADVEPDMGPDVGPDVTVDAGPDIPAVQVPYYDLWLQSGHADRSAEPFNHWNEEDPAVVPTTCAKCHSTPGFRDFIGDDGSAVGVVDAPAPIGTTVECEACHNPTTLTLDSVVFPSGVEVTGLGPEARCMTCHQGRASTDSVDEAIANAGVTDPNEVSDKLNFLNIHYYAAGATLEAGVARGGYQYEGKVYDHRFRHVPDRDTCVECHNPHSLEVRLDECKTCHLNVVDKEDLKDIRMISSAGVDYDGDGNLSEGMWFELDGLRARLLQAIQAYSTSQGQPAICYAEASYPYWFKDTDGDGSCSASEASFANAYKSWSPRILKATYNFQVSLKDPGAFAHNAKYIIQVMYDSIVDLNEGITPKLDISKLQRQDPGHFNGASEAARHWDEDEAVSASCSKCHGASEGFRFYLEYGVGLEVKETANGLDCATCHDSFDGTFDLVEVGSVTFPSGKTVDVADKSDSSNLCATCHSGRESAATIDASIASGKYSFRNVHYLPAGATKMGTEAHVGYEYDAAAGTYAGPWTTHPGGNDCINCHKPAGTNHSFDVQDVFGDCKQCHTAANNIFDIRGMSHAGDYDGDGSNTESLAKEIEGMAEALLLQMQAVATSTSNPLCYSGDSYPYWFKDTDSSGGLCDAPAETASSNGYKAWTPALMKAAHNYQISVKEPGAWAHNFNYMGQLLYDSFVDMGGDPVAEGLERP
ncbi:MAG: Ig-like domain-containing protein [Deltaproteobacteria bacterium]|nr:Ig-like domain-containing protein [Deltaproteobacteria bacterium]